VYIHRVIEERVVVIGAGVAGLACARALAARGVASVVLERSRGVGGRCATRRIEGVAVDHGVAFLSAGAPEFGAVLESAIPVADRVAGWPATVLGPKMACLPGAYRAGRLRFGVRPGISAFPKWLATGLDVRLGTTVTALAAGDGAIEVATDTAGTLRARQVVVAGAITQSLRLVEPCVTGWPGAEEPLQRLRAVEVQPSFTVVAGFPLDTPDPGFDMWHPLEATMHHTITHDSAKRRDARQRVLVLQSRPAFARERADEPDELWRDELLWEAAELIGPWVRRPLWTQTHRWRAARVLDRHRLPAPIAFRDPDGETMVAVIGDALAPAGGVEGAHRSGEMLAGLLADEAGR
jgi:hypothetical protein